MYINNYLVSRPVLYDDKRGVFSYYNLPQKGPHRMNIKTLNIVGYILFFLFLFTG